MLHGCIPVVFNPLTASAMYIWHWSESLWKDVVIEIEYQRHSKFDPVEFLKNLVALNASLVQVKQKLIRDNVFRLHYALERYSLIVGSTWPTDSEGRPLPDAFEVIMEQVLGWHSNRLGRIRNASVPECWGKAVIDVDGKKCVAIVTSET
jgi:hypothetical protein